MRVQPLTFNESQALQSASQLTQGFKNRQRSALCNAMRVGDQASPTSRDEKQDLLNNINRIKMHGSYPDTVGKDAVHNAMAGMQGSLKEARASAKDTFGKHSSLDHSWKQQQVMQHAVQSLCLTNMPRTGQMLPHVHAAPQCTQAREL